jgi:hypothetical protein
MSLPAAQMPVAPLDDRFAEMAEAGVHHFGPAADPEAAAALLAAVKATRHFDHRLFLSEAEFEADPQYKGVNPRPGRNLLEPLGERLAFIEHNPAITAYLSGLLGADYAIIDKKLVAGVPHAAVPDWVVKRIAGNAVNNLGAYVRPDYRDITYFYGIDFHQDLIDWENRTSDFITLYVYLHEVGPQDAPLYVIPGSHLLGATRFPHRLTRAGSGSAITYADDHGRSLDLHHQMLVGPAGSAYLWHALMLHGTQPDRADHERISLRYLIARGDAPAGSVGIDRVNAAVDGSLSLATTREDLAADGAARMKANAINALAGSNG